MKKCLALLALVAFAFASFAGPTIASDVPKIDVKNAAFKKAGAADIGESINAWLGVLTSNAIDSAIEEQCRSGQCGAPRASILKHAAENHGPVRKLLNGNGPVRKILQGEGPVRRILQGDGPVRRVLGRFRR
jgi:hypothetical protein